MEDFPVQVMPYFALITSCLKVHNFCLVQIGESNPQLLSQKPHGLIVLAVRVKPTKHA